MAKPIDQPAYSRALGMTLKTLRERARISQEDLADDCGLGRAHVSIIERGLGNPEYETLCKLLARLEVDFMAFGAELDANLRKRPAKAAKQKARGGEPRADENG